MDNYKRTSNTSTIDLIANQILNTSRYIIILTKRLFDVQ